LMSTVALCVGTTVLIKMAKARYSWVTLVPLVWLVVVTFTAGWQKVFSADPRLGFLAHARTIEGALAQGTLPAGATSVEVARRMLFNDRLDAAVAILFMAVVVMILLVSFREWYLILRRRKPAVLAESPFVPSTLATE
jgi:carbon starvation protein